jgi:hypothetical protein
MFSFFGNPQKTLKFTVPKEFQQPIFRFNKGYVYHDRSKYRLQITNDDFSIFNNGTSEGVILGDVTFK